jgi:DNA-binding response OmpR family regulator
MRRILVVDDEPKILSFVSRALTANGYDVDTVDTGTEALALAQSGKYELVLLDLRLPDLDGRAVLRATLATRPEQRVVILSALSDVHTKVSCLELGAIDYLPKPFALAELIARVRTRLGESAPRSHAQRFLHAGQLTLELVRRVADAGQGPVSLSEREFLLLQHLMKKKGQVCTRAELLGEVWGYSFDPGTNVVDVYVGRLRAKLGDDLIETVRNVGYFVAA